MGSNPTRLTMTVSVKTTTGSHFTEDHRQNYDNYLWYCSVQTAKICFSSIQNGLFVTCVRVSQAFCLFLSELILLFHVCILPLRWSIITLINHWWSSIARFAIFSIDILLLFMLWISFAAITLTLAAHLDLCCLYSGSSISIGGNSIALLSIHQDNFTETCFLAIKKHPKRTDPFEISTKRWLI